jgi:hypothetical protein
MQANGDVDPVSSKQDSYLHSGVCTKHLTQACNFLSKIGNTMSIADSSFC